MVKASKKKNPNYKGRPAGDPNDLRTERTAMRMHKDLLNELNAASRAVGLNRSVYIERILVNHINDVIAAEGRRPLDAIGRYYSDELLERMAAAKPAGFERLRARSQDGEYVAPRIPLGPVTVSPYGLPRRAPAPPLPVKPKKK